MKDKLQALVMAAFAADALALGAHWIYDTAVIKNDLGRVDRLMAPAPNSFHSNKEKGDFTHYGDQMLVLLESVAENGGFRFDAFSSAWRNLFSGYTGYFDHATKDTLANLELNPDPASAGSTSTDISGASRIAPLVACYRDDSSALLSSVAAQTAATHNHPDVLDSAKLFARTAVEILAGRKPVDAVHAALSANEYEASISQWVQKGLDSVGKETVAAIKFFGQACPTRNALPGVIHLLAKYEENLKEALVQNVMSGGDSAARGMVIGMLLGAYLGTEAIPDHWISEMKQRQHILDQITKIN